MNVLPFLLAPAALLLPLLAQGPQPHRPAPAALAESRRAAEAESRMRPAFDVLAEGANVPVQHQVSIIQRVIIRIAPRLEGVRRLRRSDDPPPMRSRFKEAKLKGCVPIAGIAGVGPGPDNRLLIYMRDRRLISAALDKSCNAEEFYSGAYVRRTDDGQLCPRRERLQSRTGATCEVARLSRLVPRN